MAWLLGENENIAAYIILFIHKTQDEFTIEVAWSKKKRIPPKQDWQPGEPDKADESRFRLSRLWQTYGGAVWYDLNHEEDMPEVLKLDRLPDPFGADEKVCLDRIPHKVSRALNAFEAYAIPYLKNISALPE